MAKATSLSKAYESGSIPDGGGFIVSAFFVANSTYSIFEITAYRNVKDIFKSEDGLNFRTDGNRTHLMVEPASHPKKHIEPVNREVGRSIPYRFNEMEILTGRNSEKIMIPNEPVMLYSSFTVVDHGGESYAFVFHPTKDVYIAIKKFLVDSLYNDSNLAKNDSLESARLSLETIKKFTIWEM